MLIPVRGTTIRLAAASLLILGCGLSVPSAAIADAYFDWIKSRPELLAARTYDNADEIEADINAGNPANRQNPPVYDAQMNAARWDMRIGVASPDQLRPEFPTVSSGNLLLVWEAYWDNGFLGDLGGLRQHKAFQLSKDGSNDARRIEIRTRFNFGGANDVGKIDGRGYVWNPSGAPLPGQVNDFFIAPDTWTRFWAYVDFDRREFSLWVSDETRGPVQLFDALDYNNMSGGLDNFWFEFNSSQNSGPGRTLYIWGRHFAALKDVSNVAEFLIKGSPVRPNPPGALTAE